MCPKCRVQAGNLQDVLHGRLFIYHIGHFCIISPCITPWSTCSYVPPGRSVTQKRHKGGVPKSENSWYMSRINFKQEWICRAKWNLWTVSNTSHSKLVRHRGFPVGVRCVTQAIHRDIAVRNFLVNRDGRVLLCDFGLTEFIPEGHDSLSTYCCTCLPCKGDLWTRLLVASAAFFKAFLFSVSPTSISLFQT